ncbi:hypothetical protein B0T26DRAFT_747800 [Lasiosphaeria miniovina]|uniref:Uncharacterized protein n=1 Tax=Lasiosphaeria miniovina TaxID=1954250 RepID=A0AA40B4D1_9PEZI|nr:uncharacterized protein B0T26DRAFT_747800 [Lasiosphaeria miniovina]KAK0727480.1 hypothetical protein B0T26DRAFT_747800 [Lasiosphaeria miniovina]
MGTDKTVETKAFVVVGVDFVTTYTGVAFTHSADPDPTRVTVIVQWPGSGNQSRPKVPTEISYGPSGENRWGWQLRAGTPWFGGFKLFLDPEAGSEAYNDEQLAVTLDPGNPAMESCLRDGKSATDMASDYLRLVHAEVMQALAKRFHRTLDTLKIKFIITMPAMCRPQDIIEPVTEPEAAASYALKEVNSVSALSTGGSSDGSGWQVGKQVIICDAGGGTMDLVSYSTDQVTPYLKVSETTRPRGGLCGATSLDQRFLNLVKQRLGKQAHLLSGYHGGRGSRLMQLLDSVKTNFGSNDYLDDEVVEHGIRELVPIPEHNIDNEYITLSHEDMVSIFNPVVDKVLDLVKDVSRDATKLEPSKPVAGVILVGGFGESMYLFQQLMAWCDEQKPPLFICSPKEP